MDHTLIFVFGFAAGMATLAVLAVGGLVWVEWRKVRRK